MFKGINLYAWPGPSIAAFGDDSNRLLKKILYTNAVYEGHKTHCLTMHCNALLIYVL